MKILFIATDIPYPINSGGRNRLYHIVKGLSRFNEVDFVGLSNTRDPFSAKEELSRYCRAVYAIPVDIRHSVIKLIKSFFSKTPYKVLQYFSTTMAEKIRALIKENSYDIILCEHIFVEQHIPSVSIPVVPQNIDLNYTVYKRIAEKSKGFMSWYSASQWKSLYRYEQKVLQKYNVGIALSSHEEKLMKSMVRDIHSIIVPNGVDTTYFRSAQNSSNSGENNIIFTGSYSYFPNEEAAYYFATKIFPAVVSKIPDAKYFIIGRSPSARLLNLQKRQNIIVTGEVEDIRSYLDKAQVVVAPIQFGGGTRLKVLEALAAAKAIVSTSIGCEGIDIENGKHLIIADNENSFAEAVISFLLDPQKNISFGRQGRLLIEKKYSWERITADFQESLKNYIEEYSRLSGRVNENRN
ncbi:MAG: glycosyltransferase family 4 protein [Bacteroidota bacterium]